MESTGVLQAALIMSLPLNSNYQMRVRFSTGTASSKHINSYEYLAYFYVVFLGNNDIAGSPLRITIPAGETRVNFSVPVTVDGIFEDTDF